MSLSLFPSHSPQPISRVTFVYGKIQVPADFMAILLVLTTTIITYFGLSNHTFVNYDDQRIIVNRIGSYDGLNLGNILSIIFTDHPREEPLIVRDISYLINAELFGPLNPLGYLAGNLLLHIMVSFLTYRVFLALFPTKYWPAMLTALIFALHPIHVECVAWISSRKDTLYSCLFLAAFLCYLSFLTTSKRITLLGSYSLFVCALFSKSAAIAFLPLVVAYRLLLRPHHRLGFNEILYLAVTFLSTLLFVVWYHGELDAFGVFSRQGRPLIDYNPGQWLLLNTEVLTFYLMKLCYPNDLSVIYNQPTPITLFKNLPFLGISMMVTALAIVMAIRLWRRHDNRTLFLLAWFIITLTPYLNLAGVNIFVADRYIYLPSFAAAASAALLLSSLYNKCGTRETVHGRNLGSVIIGICILYCAALAAGSIRAVKAWENSRTLWTNAHQVAPFRLQPYTVLTELNLTAYQSSTNADDARSFLRQAKEFASEAHARYCENDRCPPSMARTLTMLGKINYYEGDLTTAERHLKEAIASDPNNISPLYIYGYVLAGQGRYLEAEQLVSDIEQTADPEMLAEIRSQLTPLITTNKRQPSNRPNPSQQHDDAQ